MFRPIAYAFAALALVVPAAQAQTGDNDDTSFDELLRLVKQALPPIIGDDNTDLVNNMLGVAVPEPKFDFSKARNTLFGRRIVRLAPDCQRTGTPAGEPDQGDCRAASGQEQGSGEFVVLDFSKTPGVGNIKYWVRPEKPDQLPAVQLSDRDAYDKAKAFLSDTLGLPREELVDPPAGSDLPVSSLVIGFDKGSGMEPRPILKTVMFRRAMKLPVPIPVGGQAGAAGQATVPKELTHLPGPGMAVVHMIDGGPMGATVQGWQKVRRPDKIGRAKSRSELELEIAEDLFRAGGGRTGIIAILIGLSSQFRGSFGELLPAVQVQVSPVARDPEERQQNVQGTTAGFIGEYPLVEPLGDRAE